MIFYLAKALFFLSIMISFSFSQEKAAPVKRVNFFHDKSDIPDPFALRDPFKRPSLRRKEGGLGAGSKVGLRDGVFTNIQEIGNVEMGQISVQGIYLGKNRRAAIKVKGEKGGSVFFAKEGMKLGGRGVEVKAILPGGVVFVEKVVNIYDQEEYLETIIPISK